MSEEKKTLSRLSQVQPRQRQDVRETENIQSGWNIKSKMMKGKSDR